MTKVFTGVDPGLVHTAAVTLILDPETRQFAVEFTVIDGVDDRALDQLEEFLNRRTDRGELYVEDYRARQHYSSDVEMIRAVGKIERRFNATLINNSGMHKVFRPALLVMLHLHKMPTTHHRDLQAAGRILLAGMVKNPEHNRLLARLVEDNLLEGPDHAWTLMHKQQIGEISER